MLIELMHLCVGIDLPMSLPNAQQEEGRRGPGNQTDGGKKPKSQMGGSHAGT